MIHLDQNRVRNAFLDAASEPLRVGDKQIITHELDLVSELVGKNAPAFPVVFGQTVFNRDNGILADPISPEADHLFRRFHRLVRFLEDVFAFFFVEEFAARRIERNGNVIAGAKARLANSFENHLNGFNVGFERGSETAFVTDRGVVATLLEYSFQRMKNFRAPLQRLRKRLRAYGHGHEFLEVNVAVGMRAAVENVHHVQRHQAAEIAIERDLQRVGAGAGARHGHRKNCVGAEPSFVGSAIKLAHGIVNLALRGSIHALKSFGNRGVHVRYRSEHAFAQIMFRITIAKLHGLMLAGGSAAGDGRASQRTVAQAYVSFNRGIAPGIQNFARVYLNNACVHSPPFQFAIKSLDYR